MKVAAGRDKTHNPSGETCWVSRLRENFTSGSYGEGLETGRSLMPVPRQSFTRQLFFKWVKQNLKIKSFIGTSKNAVMTQVWIALCVYLLLAFIKFQSKLKKSMQQILRLLQLNLFEKRDLMALLRGDPVHDKQPDASQMALM